MNLLLCTKFDLVGNMMLNLILPRITGAHRVSVVLANRRRPETDAIPELKWLSLFEQELPSRLLFPLLDARAAPASMAASSGAWKSFEQLSREYGVPIRAAGHIAHHSVLTSMVREAEPDLIVSFQFGFIFKPEALACARLGGLNLHSGALPERAGVNPTFWCMKDRDREAACSLHWLSPQIDGGDIARVRRIELDYTHSFFWNWIANYRNGAEMICEAIDLLTAGQPLESRPQNPAELRFVPKPTPQDYRDFAADGLRLIDPQDCLELIGRYLPAPAATPA